MGSNPKGIVEEEEERLAHERNLKRMRPVLEAAARDDVAGIKGLITVRTQGFGTRTSRAPCETAHLATADRRCPILLPPPSLPQAGFNLDLQGHGGETMLMRASANGAFNTAQALLEAGAKVDVTKGDGRTALMLASLNGQTAMATMLLDRKASIDARSGSGESAWAIPPLAHWGLAECRCSCFLTNTPCRLLDQGTLRSCSLASVAIVPSSSCSAIEVRPCGGLPRLVAPVPTITIAN